MKGGDIKLGGSSELLGTIMAGNNLETTGEPIIHGYIIALNNNDSSEAENIIGSSITVT